MIENDKGRDQIVLSGAVPADCVVVILYTAFPTTEAAVNAGRILVENRLAGCVNVLPTMTSIYVWDGRTEVENEAVLLAKMPGRAFAPAADAINKLHPYDTPAILALPVPAINVPYLNWLSAGTDAPPQMQPEPSSERSPSGNQ